MSIKDFDYEVSLGEKNEIEVATPEIKGVLKALIVSTDVQLHIKIAFKELPDLVFFEDPQFSGVRYAPIMLGAVNDRNERLNYMGGEVVLNNAVLITVGGPKGAKASITLRVQT